MISRYYGALDHSAAEEANVYDYCALESVGEFKDLADPAEVIMIVDTETDGQACIFGKKRLLDLVALERPVSLNLLVFALPFSTDRLEHVIAAVQTVKGHHEYEP